jgi:hypothetical protein
VNDDAMSLDEADIGATDDAGLARTGRILAFAGFIPFAVLALWLYGIAPDHPWRQGTINLLTGYAAATLSFLGGIRWGIAMLGGSGERRRDLMLSAVPPLVGWAALAIKPPLVFVLLAVAFAAQGAWDSLTLPPGAAPDWFRRVRIQLTIMAVAAMVLAFVATSSGDQPGLSNEPAIAKTRSAPIM